MYKYTALAKVLDADASYLNDVLDGTRYKVMRLREVLFILVYGETKLSRSSLIAEMDGELASLGVYGEDFQLYVEVNPYHV
jgi:hypothetical protein